jgi:hypothetical protein
MPHSVLAHRGILPVKLTESTLWTLATRVCLCLRPWPCLWPCLWPCPVRQRGMSMSMPWQSPSATSETAFPSSLRRRPDLDLDLHVPPVPGQGSISHLPLIPSNCQRVVGQIVENLPNTWVCVCSAGRSAYPSFCQSAQSAHSAQLRSLSCARCMRHVEMLWSMPKAAGKLDPGALCDEVGHSEMGVRQTPRASGSGTGPGPGPRGI